MLQDDSQNAQNDAHLERALTLLPTVLYGLGVTIGAGIYVLIGAAAARAGMYAPLAFIIAGGLMALTAASFAELACRMPVAAAEAAYVRVGFDSSFLGAAVGILVIAIAIVSAAAISVGSAGYIGILINQSEATLIIGVVIAMGAIAAWGIRESVWFASIMTLIEIGGLLILVGFGVGTESEIFTRLPEAVPQFGDMTVLIAITLLLALSLPLEQLADLTARLTLVVFAFVNLALARIKLRESVSPRGIFLAPAWMPWVGAVSCVVLLVAEVLFGA